MKNKKVYIGFLGLMGLMGFKSLLYFKTGDSSYLSYVGFFCFFSWFFIGIINSDKMDERYIENKKTAIAFIAPLGVIAIPIIWSSTVLIKDIELIRALIFLLSAILLNTYAIKLYILEER